MTTSAMILFAHGARSAGWAAPFERLRDLARARLPGVTVELAFLELMAPRLPDLVAQLARAGVAQVTVVPVFLGQGGHVLRDLPLLTAQLRAEHPALDIKVVEAAGENPQVLNAIADYCVGAIGGAG
ncbi:MAG TPA: CbiX/SirB N-terminal domain-containing protein [Janthinobacterium sp.]|nr:CbiX/SirB N-terminal domain-containing protein [Janthinobacterium sp.]